MAAWQDQWAKAVDPDEREASRVSIARKRKEASAELASHLKALPLADREWRIRQPATLAKLTDADIAAVHASMMRDAVRADRMRLLVKGVSRAARILRERFTHALRNAASGAKGLTKDGFSSEGRITLGEALIASLRAEHLLPNAIRFAVAWMVAIGTLPAAAGIGVSLAWHALIIQAVAVAFMVAGWGAWKGFGLRHAAVPLFVANMLAGQHWDAWMAGFANTARINPALLEQPLAIAAVTSGMPLGPFLAHGTIWVVGLTWMGLVGVRLARMFGIDLLGIARRLINNKKGD